VISFGPLEIRISAQKRVGFLPGGDDWRLRYWGRLSGSVGCEAFARLPDRTSGDKVVSWDFFATPVGGLVFFFFVFCLAGLFHPICSYHVPSQRYPPQYKFPFSHFHT
jgi:hypothetical protein